MTLDRASRGGTLATALDAFRADSGARNGAIAPLGLGLAADDVIDATDRLVLRGGIDSYVRLAQVSGEGALVGEKGAGRCVPRKPSGLASSVAPHR